MKKFTKISDEFLEISELCKWDFSYNLDTNRGVAREGQVGRSPWAPLWGGRKGEKIIKVNEFTTQLQRTAQ